MDHLCGRLPIEGGEAGTEGIRKGIDPALGDHELAGGCPAAEKARSLRHLLHHQILELCWEPLHRQVGEDVQVIWPCEQALSALIAERAAKEGVWSPGAAGENGVARHVEALQQLDRLAQARVY